MTRQSRAFVPNARSHRARIVAAFVLAAGIPAAFSAAEAQSARDYVSIVGSSTVYPFATVVAERFGRATDFKTPKIESTGTGGGFKLFCDGIGVQHPDITNASRRVKRSEVQNCIDHGVDRIVEVKLGYDGIVVANSRQAPQLSLTLEHLYLALAKDVPDPESGAHLVPNPYMRWSQIDPSLPDVRIEVYGPPPTSGTRDAFLELAMEPGCSGFPAIEALDDDAFTRACHTIREDNLYIASGENDNLIVQKLDANPDALGIFGYSFLEQNSDQVQGSLINGVEPTFDAIADEDYPISRPLFFYVKAAHVGVIPGIREFLAEFTSDSAWGEYGYLSDKGLVPLPDDERREVAAVVRGLETLDPQSIEQ
jgi:phosphate transport system substrate-binding protein